MGRPNGHNRMDMVFKEMPSMRKLQGRGQGNGRTLVSGGVGGEEEDFTVGTHHKGF